MTNVKTIEPVIIAPRTACLSISDFKTDEGFDNDKYPARPSLEKAEAADTFVLSKIKQISKPLKRSVKSCPENDFFIASKIEFNNKVAIGVTMNKR